MDSYVENARQQAVCRSQQLQKMGHRVSLHNRLLRHISMV